MTYGEVAEIKSLVIDSTYNPTVVINYENAYARVPGTAVHGAYIDLVDLQYFENLEELTVIAFLNADSIVNIDSISNCQKLKELRIPCNPGKLSARGISAMGYKYWADIIANLPELEYIDLGMYIDDHMKTVMLSKTDNKDIVFYNGEDTTERQVAIKEYMSSFMESYMGYSMPLLYEIENSEEYNDAWGKEIKGYYDYAGWCTNLDYILGRDGIFPMLAGTQEEIVEKLATLDADTEDIIIMLKDKEFDFSVLSRFENLVTLSVICRQFDMETEMVFNPELGVEEITGFSYVGAVPINLESLVELEHLQTLGLQGFVGDLSSISSCKNLREISITKCVPENLEFIGELQNAKELIISMFSNESDDSAQEAFYEQFDKEIFSLTNLKYYRDENGANEASERYKGIEKMTSLETLYVQSVKGAGNNILKGEQIQNLYLGGALSEHIDLNVDNMEKLEVIVINTYSSNVTYDYESLLGVESLVAVCFSPNIYDYIENCTPELGELVAKHPNISAFLPKLTTDTFYPYRNGINTEYIAELYNAGVYGGVVENWISLYRLQGEEYTIEDYIKTFKK